MLILLTNDDGIYAPGLAALQRELSRLGDVRVVAPATEQSGVGHAITYLTPLVVREVFHNEVTGGGDRRRWGWAVEGSPADCVKIGIAEFCPRRPDLVVSGMNSGLNAGINVLYSGTVAAAIEGAFFGITSIAVSLEFEEHAQFEKACRLARQVIEQILQNRRLSQNPGRRTSEPAASDSSGIGSKGREPQLYNMNIPTAALRGTPKVCVVPMNVTRYGDRFEKRRDPWGRDYYWLTGGPAPLIPEHETDLSALSKGRITLTPLDYNMTRQTALADMEHWRFRLDAGESRGAGKTSRRKNR